MLILVVVIAMLLCAGMAAVVTAGYYALYGMYQRWKEAQDERVAGMR